MSKSKTYNLQAVKTYSKWEDYTMLIKLRLSLVVVATSILGYMIAAGTVIYWREMLLLAIGGMLVTAAANTLNQVLEKDYDKLMQRTMDRPLAAGRMKVSEAVMFAGMTCLFGVSILAIFNPITALLGMLSFITYAFIYTPLKRFTTMSVAIGAVPGALPVLIGFTAFTGSISYVAIALFAIQFLWQFPHFWAIGYLAFDDYNGAGYKLLPTKNGKIDPSLGLHAAIYGMMIIPFAWMAYVFGGISMIGLVLTIVMTIVYSIMGLHMYRQQDRKSALLLMFTSFFYMPLVLVAFYLWP